MQKLDQERNKSRWIATLKKVKSYINKESPELPSECAKWLTRLNASIKSNTVSQWKIDAIVSIEIYDVLIEQEITNLTELKKYVQQKDEWILQCVKANDAFHRVASGQNGVDENTRNWVLDVKKQYKSRGKLSKWRLQYINEEVLSVLFSAISGNSREERGISFSERIKIAEAIIQDHRNPIDHMDENMIVWLRTYLTNYLKETINPVKALQLKRSRILDWASQSRFIYKKHIDALSIHYKKHGNTILKHNIENEGLFVFVSNASELNQCRLISYIMKAAGCYSHGNYNQIIKSVGISTTNKILSPIGDVAASNDKHSRYSSLSAKGILGLLKNTEKTRLLYPSELTIKSWVEQYVIICESCNTIGIHGIMESETLLSRFLIREAIEYTKSRPERWKTNLLNKINFFDSIYLILGYSPAWKKSVYFSKMYRDGILAISESSDSKAKRWLKRYSYDASGPLWSSGLGQKMKFLVPELTDDDLKLFFK